MTESQMEREWKALPVPHAMTPTLAEVRWVRKVPFYGHRDLHFVGLKFLV